MLAGIAVAPTRSRFIFSNVTWMPFSSLDAKSISLTAWYCDDSGSSTSSTNMSCPEMTACDTSQIRTSGAVAHNFVIACMTPGESGPEIATSARVRSVANSGPTVRSDDAVDVPSFDAAADSDALVGDAGTVDRIAAAAPSRFTPLVLEGVPVPAPDIMLRSIGDRSTPFRVPGDETGVLVAAASLRGNAPQLLLVRRLAP
mmetsp:Transcript_4185/g.13605  ORF Transcript_4185/g.13605 Transcript_4185/m.13605 type:complete len:201 (-) Transcript_4185:723-1325(-)